MIKLGSKVRDSISGYEGIATARSRFLNGCVQLCIEGPLAKDEKGVARRDDLWFDEQRVELIERDAWKPQGEYAVRPQTVDESPEPPGALELGAGAREVERLARSGGPQLSMPSRDGV